MTRYFKMIVILFAFLFVCACSNNDNIYNLKTVSSSEFNYRVSSDEEDVLKANVMIFNENYSSFLGLNYKENNSYGSGVIYNSDDSYYYVLTNNHVVNYDYEYNNHELIIEDYYFNRYKGEVIYSDAAYDLAIVRFEKNYDLKALTISQEADVRNSVRSMGNPGSVKNVINNGMINCFTYIKMNSEESKVDFEVIVHSAPIAGGSSGGALLNSKNEIIGITFAGVFDNNGQFITGYAIPSDKIIEFLSK